MIKTVNLTKKYGELHAIQGIELDLDEGDLFGFIGPNGAGKTTTMSMMMNGMYNMNPMVNALLSSEVTNAGTRTVSGVSIGSVISGLSEILTKVCKSFSRVCRNMKSLIGI